MESCGSVHPNLRLGKGASETEGGMCKGVIQDARGDWHGWARTPAKPLTTAGRGAFLSCPTNCFHGRGEEKEVISGRGCMGTTLVAVKVAAHLFR